MTFQQIKTKIRKSKIRLDLNNNFTEEVKSCKFESNIRQTDTLKSFKIWSSNEDKSTEQNLKNRDVKNKATTNRFNRSVPAKCIQNFHELQNKCEEISNEIELDMDPYNAHIIMDGIEIDANAAENIPSVMHRYNLFPCKVKTDGNCLPSSAIVFAYRDIDQVEKV